jgi:hypothetical protein
MDRKPCGKNVVCGIDVSVPLCFVLQLPDELTASHIGDGLGKAVIFDQVLDLQTLDADDLVLAYDLSRELVLRVTASIAYASVYPGNDVPGLCSVLGTFFLLGVPSLRPCQLLFLFGEEL